MKRFLLFFLLLLSTNICFANDLNLKDFTAFKINPYLLFNNKTYKDYFPAHYGCFAYLNKDKIKLQGKTFDIEYACATWNPNQTPQPMPSIDGSVFYYLDNNNKVYKTVKANPYYFKNTNVLYDIEAIFTNREQLFQ